MTTKTASNHLATLAPSGDHYIVTLDLTTDTIIASTPALDAVDYRDLINEASDVDDDWAMAEVTEYHDPAASADEAYHAGALRLLDIDVHRAAYGPRN